MFSHAHTMHMYMQAHMHTWVSRSTNNHISDLLATLHPRTCPYWADLLLAIISRKHERPCRPALVPISYAHCIISTQQPLIMQVWHQLLLMTMRGRERIFVPGKRKTRSHITPFEAAVNVSQCQGVFVFPSADQDALELLSVTTVLSIYVCVWAFICSHTLWLHTHTLGTLRVVEKSGRGCVSLQERWQKVVYMTPSMTLQPNVPETHSHSYLKRYDEDRGNIAVRWL